MKKTNKTFPFKKARRVTQKEVTLSRKAIEKKLKAKRPPRGRPLKPEQEKYKPISIRLRPKVIASAKKMAAKRKVGYQTIINEVLEKNLG